MILNLSLLFEDTATNWMRNKACVSKNDRICFKSYGKHEDSRNNLTIIPKT